MKTKCMSCGGSMKKMQNGGRTISEKAAERKAEKDKGLYVSSTKSYIPYTKAGRKEVKETGGTDVWNMKPTRRVMKKMAVGGTTTKRIIKKSTGGMYGIPQENLGTSGQYGFAKKGGATKKYQKGGATKATKFAALAPPYNKATFADKIVGAKKSAKKK